MIMGELLDRLNEMDSRPHAPGEPIKSLADQAAGIFRSASERVNEAIDHAGVCRHGCLSRLGLARLRWRGSRYFRWRRLGRMLELLQGMGFGEDLTVHGFRSTFKDWCSEQTGYPNEMSEMALAHAVSDKVEAAYRRGDMREKRRRLMADWAAFCASPVSAKKANVVQMRG
jgi:integrase